MSVTPAERCPWCGSTITHAKFLQIQEAIREDEHRKLVAAEKSLKARLEKELTDRVAKERKALDAERTKIARQLEQVKQAFERQRKKDIAEVRQILQKDKEATLAKREAEFSRERDALQKKIADISRRVKKGGLELAEGSELDVFEELRGAFPDDEITRTKSKDGGNVLHEVLYKGKSAGRILVDTRSRGSWQHAFVTKLRQDQSEVGADHAILATSVFPAGRRELFVDAGVIVVAPARVRAIVEVLRKVMIAMHVAKLSDAERADKLGRLFKFMTSPAFRKKFAEASDLTNEALQIDVDEQRAHALVWRKRGTVLTRMKNVLREIDTDVSAIVEARDDNGPGGATLRPAAFRVTTR